MKKILFLLAPLAVAASIAFNTGEPLPVGSPMPMADHKMMDVKTGDNTTMRQQVKGNGLMIMFSCNTCPYVIKNQERTNAAAEFAEKNNIGVVLVNSNEALRADADSYEAMKEYANGQRYQWSYVVDSKSAVADAFGANRTPECFLFDKNLKLVYHGAIDDNPSDGSAVTRKHLKEAMAELSAGKDISVKESRSVGCTIKRIKQ